MSGTTRKSEQTLSFAVGVMMNFKEDGGETGRREHNDRWSGQTVFSILILTDEDIHFVNHSLSYTFIFWGYFLSDSLKSKGTMSRC